MLTFREFLNESGQASDDQGKLHEVLVGAHLNRLIHGKFSHMSSFRDENGKTPEDVHNNIATRISAEQYKKQSDASSDAAEKIHAHLKEHHPELLKQDANSHVKVSWTSQPKDHEQLTGKKDSGASGGGADIMVTKHDSSGHAKHVVGYSLKRAKGTITLANRGAGSVENELGMPKGSLTKHDNDHDERTTKILAKFHAPDTKITQASKHAIYKAARDNPNRTPEQQQMMDDVHKSDKARNIEQASTIAEHLRNHKHLVSNLISPEHTFAHYQAETVPGKSTNIQDVHKKVVNKLSSGNFDVEHKNERVRFIDRASGKSLADLEVRSKGRPAGAAANVCPHVSKALTS